MKLFININGISKKTCREVSVCMSKGTEKPQWMNTKQLQKKDS